MTELPDAATLTILRDAMGALGPQDLSKLAAAIKSAKKTNTTNIRDVERVLREMGDALMAKDPNAAETFYTLAETLAEAREAYERKRGML